MKYRGSNAVISRRVPVMCVPGFEVASGHQAARAHTMGFVERVSEEAVFLRESRE